MAERRTERQLGRPIATGYNVGVKVATSLAQEKLIFLRPYTEGRAPLTERQIRPITAEPNWDK